MLATLLFWSITLDIVIGTTEMEEDRFSRNRTNTPATGSKEVLVTELRGLIEQPNRVF